MNLRTTIYSLTAAALLSASGCAFITKLTSAGGADASAFTVDMEGYDVKSIALSRAEASTSLCPGASVTVKIRAEVVDKKKSKTTFLESADPKGDANEARGKMDITEFAMSGRGGVIENGVFTANPDPFAALMGYDIKAIYRLDKTKEAEKHLGVDYSCFSGIGSSGASGQSGSSGSQGAQYGGAGGFGSGGGPGGPGPRLVAHASIIRTPLYDKVGIIRVTGDVEQMSLFDLSAGITLSARGGSGGYGGSGGDGGRGNPENQGSGGPGGGGADGGPGGDGGQIVLTLDDRYPELVQAVRVDVSGGSPGSGGRGGRGGQGAPAKTPCSGCSQLPAGANGPDGSSGNDGTVSGRPGESQVKTGDVSAMFAELPPGVRLRTDARPEPVAAPPPPPSKPGKKKKTK